MSVSRGPRGPYSTGIARRRQIVDEAIRVFGSVGYHGGSLRRIAAQVGVSPTAISRHFADKEDLLTAVLERWDEESRIYQDPAAEGLGCWLAFRDALRYHEENRNMLALFLTVVSESTSPAHPAHEFMQRRYAQTLIMLRDGLLLAIERGEVRPLATDEVLSEARSFLAFVDGIELQYLLQDDFGLLDAFDEEWSRRLARWRAVPEPVSA